MEMIGQFDRATGSVLPNKAVASYLLCPHLQANIQIYRFKSFKLFKYDVFMCSGVIQLNAIENTSL